MKDANAEAHEAASLITAENDLGPLEAAVMGDAISRMYRRAFPAVSSLPRSYIVSLLYPWWSTSMQEMLPRTETGASTLEMRGWRWCVPSLGRVVAKHTYRAGEPCSGGADA